MNPMNVNSTKSRDGAAATSGSSSSMDRCETACILCADDVILSSDGGDPNAHNAELHQLLLNLCHHFGISKEGIPSEQCSKTRFPLCDERCKVMVDEISKQHHIVEQAMLKIEETLGEIEKVVTNAEILDESTVSPVMVRPGGPKKSLRDLIVEVFRKKLQARKQQQENAVNENGDEDNGLENSDQDSSPFMVKQERMEAESSAEDEDVDDVLPPPQTRTPDSSDDGQEEQELEEQMDPESADAPGDDENLNWSLGPGEVAITNENDETNEISLLEIKHEAHASAGIQNDDEEEEDNDDVLTLANQDQRRLLSEGIEVFRAKGNGVRKTRDNLSKASSSYTKMKTHIRHVNKNKSGLTKQRKSTRNSNATHSAPITGGASTMINGFKCQVCERSFLSNCNLMRHMKSIHTVHAGYDPSSSSNMMLRGRRVKVG